MRKFILPLVASLAFATPALADTRAEVRGGVITSQGTSQDTWGAAAGVDFDLAPMVFAGVEVSGDKIADTGTKVAWGTTGRIGVKTPTGTKLYGTGGYTTAPCDLCDGQWHAGAGVQQKIGGPLYIKGEYRHFFESNTMVGADAFVAGLGISF